MYVAGSIIVFILLISLLASLASPVKPVQLASILFVKVIVGAFFLFLLNSFSGDYGLHVPINLITSTIAGVLGLAGVAALAVIQLWIL